MPGIEFGWKVHAAIQDWTRTVDQKASIMLVFSVALGTLAGREVFHPDGGLYASHGLRLWLVRTMAVFFTAAALLALSVVLPRLRRRATKAEAPRGLIYFGHLRHREAGDIADHLRRLDDDEQLEQLARQLGATAMIAWRKHARLQAAMGALVVAATLFAVGRLAV